MKQTDREKQNMKPERHNWNLVMLQFFWNLANLFAVDVHEIFLWFCNIFLGDLGCFLVPCDHIIHN